MSAGRREGALEPEEDERVRAVVRQLVVQHGSQNAAARKVGVSQQTISRHLEGFPAGKAFARKVAVAASIDYDKMLGRLVVRESSTPMFGNLPEWPTVLAQARERYKRIPEEAWAGAAENSAGLIPPGRMLTAEIVAQAARLWEEAQAAPLRSEAEVQAEIDADEPLD